MKNKHKMMQNRSRSCCGWPSFGFCHACFVVLGKIIQVQSLRISFCLPKNKSYTTLCVSVFLLQNVANR